MYALVCVFKIFSETIGPTEAKFHVEPQWDRGRKFIQIFRSFVGLLSLHVYTATFRVAAIHVYKIGLPFKLVLA